VQYLYGPVFQAIGYDIAGLRLFRLLTVLGAHLAFGWGFMAWLRLRRPTAPKTWLWEAAGVATIVACGGTAYGWLPLSPGYNDVSLLGALFAAAVVLRMAVRVERGERIPPWVPAAIGPVVVAMLLAKWASSAVTLSMVTIAAVAALAPAGWRVLLRAAAWAAAGVLATLVLIQLLVVPLNVAVPDMIATNRLVAAGANAPSSLLTMYLRTTEDLFRAVEVNHGLLFATVLLALVARGRVTRFVALGIGAIGIVISARRLGYNGYFDGGPLNLNKYPVALTVTIVVVALIGIGALLEQRRPERESSLRNEGWRGWTIYAAIATLPVTQAAGTGNPLYFMAFNGFAVWVALMIAVLSGVEAASQAARWFATAAVAAAVLMTTAIATDSLWQRPYRGDPYRLTTASAPGVPALDGIKLAPGKARDFSDLRRRLAPYLDPPGRPIMAFDEMAGVVLVLDGRPVGEAWYSAIDPGRTATGIREVCRDGSGWWGDRHPILIFRRPVTETETGALGSCGLSFATDYRLLAPAEETAGLEVFVPTETDGQR
jgi:hypothetical protein